MECDKCPNEAVMHAAYSGLHMCDAHFCASVEKRVRRRVQIERTVFLDERGQCRVGPEVGCRLA